MNSDSATIRHATMPELEAGLALIREAPRGSGVVEMIVRRTQVGAREVLVEGLLSLEEGLGGDNWKTRGSSSMPDGSANPDFQLTVMNSRVIALLTGNKASWQWAGDQLFIDMDLSIDNLPPGTRLAIGLAVIEISKQPHTGCKKFMSRFGAEALQFVNSPLGKQLRLRGLNAKVVQPGAIRVGDVAQKL